MTAILPHSGNLFREKVPGAVYVGNKIILQHLRGGLAMVTVLADRLYQQPSFVRTAALEPEARAD